MTCSAVFFVSFPKYQKIDGHDKKLSWVFLEFSFILRDPGDHFKVVGLKKSGQYKEALSSVFRNLSCIWVPSYLQPQQI